jgi:DUF4097 and DUF4098 domain-containing protein YvlB
MDNGPGNLLPGKSVYLSVGGTASMTPETLCRGRLARGAAIALVALGIPALATAAAKETEKVEKTIPFAAGGTIRLKNFSGKVDITGESRSDIALVAIRTATRDRLDRIKLDIQSSGNEVAIDANKRMSEWHEHNDNVVDTEFTLKVPSNANLDIDVFSSPVTVVSVNGHHHVHGFSSDLRLDKTTGPVDAETFSGAIHVAPATWVKDQSLSAKTFSGDIEVQLPEAAGGQLEFESFSGDIQTINVPLVFKSKSKRSLRAELSSGQTGELFFKTFSGDVKLLR